MEKSSSSTGRGPGRFNNTLYGVVIGAVLVGLVWMFSGAVHGSGDSSTAGGASSSGPSGSESATASPTGAAQLKQALRAEVLTDCRRVFHTQARPLRAAAAAMAQWQVHIGAMNQLVLGAISLQQATQFWSQTRVGARAHLRAFRRAEAPLRKPSVLCPAPGSAAHAGKVVRCERAVAARFETLRTAQVALGTWRLHVSHMEMLRDGTMTPHQAETAWLQSWHAGQQEVTRYRTATEHAAHGPHC